MKNIIVKEKVINVTGSGDDDYISLTDIARKKSNRAKGCCQELDEVEIDFGILRPMGEDK